MCGDVDLRVLEVDDQPALAEGRAAHADAERAADAARGAVARDQIVAAQIALAAVVLDAQRDAIGALRERQKLVAEGGFDVRKARQRFLQLPLEDRLAEGVAARKAVGLFGRLHLGEQPAARRIIIRAVAGDGLAHYRLDQTGRLHGAQRLVVDRHRARLVHRGGVALDQQAADAVDAEQIGERQAGRPATGDDDGIVGAEHDAGHPDGMAPVSIRPRA